MTALYVLAGEYAAAAALLADMDADEQTIADTLEGMAGDMEAKAANVAMFVRNLEATALQIAEAERQMAARRKAMERRADGVRRYLLGCLQSAGVSKIECPQFRISVRDNPAAVDVFDPVQVPAEYLRAPAPPPPGPDKAAIKAALLAGADVPGCRLTRGQRLEVAA
jgi:Siphovirus Gp157